MFRKLSRINKAVPFEECIRILKNEKRGVLSVIGDNDYPYGMPMNHFYNPDDGKIYFHCGKNGHRNDSIKKNVKVSFCVYDGGIAEKDDWALNFTSVIVFGVAELIEDNEKIIDICRKLCYKFTDDSDYIENEIKAFSSETILIALTPEHICGKKIKES